MSGWIVLAALIPAALAISLIKRILALLPEFPIAPGPWFIQYGNDWAAAHGIPQWEAGERVTSAIISGSGGFIWATQTPEWDREWFGKRNFEFPTRWIPFSALETYWGMPGEVVHLDV